MRMTFLVSLECTLSKQLEKMWVIFHAMELMAGHACYANADELKSADFTACLDL